MSEPALPSSPKVERSGNVTILTFTADTIRDIENVIARELGGLTTGPAGRHLLLDFINVSRLNSGELGTLIALHKQVRAAGGRLTLFNLSPDLLEVFAVTRLDTFLGICTQAEAVADDLDLADRTTIPELRAL